MIRFPAHLIHPRPPRTPHNPALPTPTFVGQPDHQPNYRLGQHVVIVATEDNPCDGRRGIVEWIRPEDGYWLYGVRISTQQRVFYGVQTAPPHIPCRAWQLSPDRSA